ncbi:MAG TPA: SIS domain-containing protein [Gaiellaceae bacterium]|jgi:glucosamine--fructose-6-phosphate aminotransferase (isomerizing)|nr:SIS domain-containing protein [Gaiellaceae bacterium]
MTTHLERELREQPQALMRLIDTQRATAQRIGRLFGRDDVRYILIASRGSSSNAARYAQYVLGRSHRVPVSFATPSLYTLYEQPPRLDGALVIGISQSGRSPDVKEVIEEARRQGRPTVAITNDAASPLAEASDEVLALEAGDELAVAATKTYVNSLGAVALLFALATDDRTALAELQRIPSQLSLQIERSWDDAQAVDRLGAIEGGTVIARGVNYATCFEVALKIRELSGLLFESYSAADLMHGPVAAIASGWPVIAVAPRGPALQVMLDALDALSARGPRLVVISDDERALARGEIALPLWTRVPDWLSPLVAVVPGQLAAFRLAELRGVDLDSPLGLSKVTLTR